MKNCKTVKGLIKTVSKKENANLKVWDIQDNHFVEGGACLNLGEGKKLAINKE